MLSSEVCLNSCPALPVLDGPLTGADKELMANDLLNDILETAMDIAEGVKTADEQPDIKNIIDSLSKLNSKIPVMSRDPNKLGIGDSLNLPAAEVKIKPSKLVEKKTRVTDLVMNSKKALANILNEEQRRKQDEWEEANEHVVQVIELEPSPTKLDPFYPETYPLPYDEDESDLLMPQDPSQLESVDLAREDASAGISVGGKGDEKKASKTGTLNRLGSFLNHSARKKKHWLAGFRLCNFRKSKRNKDLKEENEELDSNAILE